MALSTGLPVSRYVSVAVSLTSPAVIMEAINTAAIIVSDPAIDQAERLRRYANISEVASEFGTTSPAFRAAEAWFSQLPSPDNVLIGRWVKDPAPAILVGGILSHVEMSILAWQAISDGEFAISIGGAPPAPITGLDFSAAANLNAVATIITAGLTGATCTWNGQQFLFSTTATGVTAIIGYLSEVAAGTGTDLSALLKGTVATAGRLVGGAAPETALSALATIDSLYSSNFYGVIVPEGDDEDQLDCAAYVEASDPVHYLGVTSSDTRTLDPLSEDDLGSLMGSDGMGFNKTAIQYSTTNPYAVCSYLARILTTRWFGVNTMITLMYKRQPGVAPENLSSQQADTLQDKAVNVYTGVANGATIIQYGTSCSGEYTDTIIGADALALSVQNSIFNVMYTTNTKVPQTDAGMSLLTSAADATCAVFAANGYLGPGTWNAPGFGSLVQGDMLPLGYYTYAPSMGDQDVSDRAARLSTLIQIAAKTAGAIHKADVLIYVNQ